jgi:Flp pilus assembly CpaE family ATPase
VETTLGRPLTWSLPDDWKTASTAVNVGSPLLESAPKSRLRAALQQIALAMAGRGEAQPEPEKVSAAETKRRKLLPFLSS